MELGADSRRSAKGRLIDRGTNRAVTSSRPQDGPIRLRPNAAHPSQIVPKLADPPCQG